MYATKPKAEWPKLLLSIDEVALMLDISRRHLFRLRSSGEFPEPDAMIGRRERWRPATIDKWVDGGGSAPKRRKRG